MRNKLLLLALLSATCVFAGPRVFFGIGFGAPVYYAPPPPPPPPVVSYAAPVYPGPGYTWVAGYYYPVGARYVWHGGYWARPPYVGARWVAPRYYSHRYYAGYWRR